MSQFSYRLKQLRAQYNYSMQQLADLAMVSKSMISKIEREEVQPTLDIATRLAQALGMTLSAMLDDSVENMPIKIERTAQSIWEDPSTHVLRRLLSPPQDSLEWLEVTLPSQTQLFLSAMNKGGRKYILVKEGEILLEVLEQKLSFKAGDSGHFLADSRHSFQNPTRKKAVYYLIIKP